MSESIHALAQHLFGKSSVEECSVEEIRHLVKRYPYFAPAQFLLLQKLKAEGSPDYEAQFRKAVLYYSDPLQFDFFIDSKKFYVEDSQLVVTEEISTTTSPATVQQEMLQRSNNAVAKEPTLSPLESSTEEEPIKEEATDVSPVFFVYDFLLALPAQESIEASEQAEKETAEKTETPVADNFSETQNLPEDQIQKEGLLIEEGVELSTEVLPSFEETQPVEIADEAIEVNNESIPEEAETNYEDIAKKQASPAMTFFVENVQATKNIHSNEFSTETTPQEAEKQPEELKQEQAVAEQKTEEVSTENRVELNNQPSSEVGALVSPPSETLIFEPYYTVDYFASQGIKVSAEDLTKDKLGKQLRSFTEWLKMMKRLPAAQIAKSSTTLAEKSVESMANHSIIETDVVTEAMAEVWAKQGNREKAVETYNKLCLLNPSKKAYFAAKIENLKPS